jgi:hypothetical protein
MHMVASLDGFIARRDGHVERLETSDNFEGADTMTLESVADFLRTIDCYVMGSRTYETALGFEAKGWVGPMATSRPSSSPIARCGRPGAPWSSTRAISGVWWVRD